MKNNLLFSLLSLGVVATASLASAAETLVYINTQELMHESTAAKSLREQLDAKQKTFRAEVGRKEDDLKKEEQSLVKQRDVLAKDVFEKKVKEFQEKVTALGREKNAKTAELDNAAAASFEQIQKTVTDIVSKVAKEKGYSAVLQASAMLYADPRLDITKEVSDKLNAALPKVTANFKSATKSDE